MRDSQDKFFFDIYTDGSFHAGRSDRAGWSWVAVLEKKMVVSDAGVTDSPALSRNIDGEVYGVLNACKWLGDSFPNARANIFVDYIGLIRWANKEWTTKKIISTQFVEGIAPYLSKITFTKVLAHSTDKSDPHVYWNGIADRLANEALEKQYNSLLDHFKR